MAGRSQRPSRLAVASLPSDEATERLIRLRQEAQRIVAELFQGSNSEQGSPAGPRIPVDICETKEAFVLTFDLPGVRRQDLRVQVMGSTLIVEGKKREELRARGTIGRVDFDCAERVYGPFLRVIELPGAADTGTLWARLGDGVLQVRLAKILERRGRKREVVIE